MKTIFKATIFATQKYYLLNLMLPKEIYNKILHFFWLPMSSCCLRLVRFWFLISRKKMIGWFVQVFLLVCRYFHKIRSRGGVQFVVPPFLVHSSSVHVIVWYGRCFIIISQFVFRRWYGWLVFFQRGCRFNLHFCFLIRLNLNGDIWVSLNDNCCVIGLMSFHPGCDSNCLIF